MAKLITGTRVYGNATIDNVLSLGSSATNGSNGFVYLPSGLKLNWGYVAANSSTGNATFASPYILSCYSVTCTSQASGNIVPYVTANTTVAVIRTGSTAAAVNIYYMAIGY